MSDDIDIIRLPTIQKILYEKQTNQSVSLAKGKERETEAATAEILQAAHPLHRGTESCNGEGCQSGGYEENRLLQGMHPATEDSGQEPGGAALSARTYTGCNNINQIAHHLNREGLHAETLSKVNAMLAWFREIKNLSNNN